MNLHDDVCQTLVGMSIMVESIRRRIAQEALTNAMLHAEARRIEFVLAAENDLLQLEVRDRGRGFTVTASSEGLGLFSMEERALGLGGSLRVRSEPGVGTTVQLVCPLRDGAAAETDGSRADVRSTVTAE